VISLMEDLQFEVLAMREGGVWEPHDDDHGHSQDHGHDHGHGQPWSIRRSRHGHSQDHGHDHGHSQHRDHGHAHHREDGHGEWDSHIWLSPENARRIVTGLTDHLGRWDPANAEAYARNRDALLERVDMLDAELARQLEPVRDLPFIVFHDAYQYFEHAYGLNAAGSITVDPSRAPGARRIQELRDRMSADDVVCLFTEPQFRPAVASILVEGHSTRLGELDPIGTSLEPGPDAWFDLMRGLADDLVSCLEPREG
jgi:zinc transport system substrate-binding protein